MTTLRYPLVVAMILAASCGDSENQGPEYLFVQTSDGATLTDSTLTLTGISPTTGWFTDRPYRAAGQIPTEKFLILWEAGDDSFADDPPNADLTCTVDGEVVNYFVEVRSPRLDGDDLIYEVRALDGSSAPIEPVACSDTAHLFIDSLEDYCEKSELKGFDSLPDGEALKEFCQG